MYNNETCIHYGVSPKSLLDNLHHSQAGKGRHRCPTCAYEHGYILGSSNVWKSYEDYCGTLVENEKETCKEGSTVSIKTLLDLGENQGGLGRHKCTNCAFKAGFDFGLLVNKNPEYIVETVSPPAFEDDFIYFNSKAIQIDFIEQESKNKRLGLLGEQLILNSEISFLINNGKDDLAKKIKHVSIEEGDGLGYDILSFDLAGNEKKIEVKTTRSNISRPFFLTINELNISIQNPNNYYLYRLFDFDSNLNKGKLYIIEGDLSSALNLHPVNFKAIPKK
ncbi:MAG: DUF3883 domain-containing protein [Cytophagaceae bacterium]|nr:DUF3883 domain-containing protein [Cytophagaceae bacterium]